MQFRFCPKCSGEFKEFFEGEYARLKCTKCGFIFYDKSYITVSALIVEGDRVLLAKRAKDPFKEYWDVVGGFLEKGEHPEAALHREVKEETGLEVEITDFLGFFMDVYGDEAYSTLCIGYIVKIKHGEPKAADDVSEVQWFSKDDIPKNVAFKSNREMLNTWLKTP